MGRLRNSLRSDSPRHLPSAAQAEGAARGLKSKPPETRHITYLLPYRHSERSEESS